MTIATSQSFCSAWYAGFYEEGCDGTRDIAFLELARDVPEGIHHVCLPHLHDVDDMDDATTKLFSCGFGSNRKRTLFTLSLTLT